MTKHDEIAAVLTEEILSERFRPGERLPSERDLAARFEANRGAVREAMKMVQQLGLASIQPGGARVEPLQNASLDVIGNLLRRSEGPNPHLVAEIIEVINSLVQVAAGQVIRNGSDQQIEEVRLMLQPQLDDSLAEEEKDLARMEFLRTVMLASDHLVCQLIARALFEQLIPNVGERPEHVPPMGPRYKQLIESLDTAFAKRDEAKAREVLREMEEVNRQRIYEVMAADAQVVEVQL